MHAEPDETEATSTSESTGTGTAEPLGPTFWQDVAPIYYERCVSCHREGGIGPFSLESYADAEPWSVAVAAATEARTMPPWLVTDDGTCGEFRHSRWMPQEEIELIAQWIEEGTVEGTPRDDLQVPEGPGIASPTIIETPDFVPEIQGGALAEFDEYRCFMIDPQLPADRFLTAYDVLPGNEAVSSVPDRRV